MYMLFGAGITFTKATAGELMMQNCNCGLPWKRLERLSLLPPRDAVDFSGQNFNIAYIFGETSIKL